MNVGILVVDDEPLARRRLAGFVANVSWARQIGEAGDGAAALDCIGRLKPEIVFLDIQMPELSGLQVVDRLRAAGQPPAVIFTTAYDQHAVTAFELQAIDYLLKPFGEARFRTALERARGIVEARDAPANLERAHAALADAPARTPLQRFFVRHNKTVLPLACAEVERIEAQDDYVLIHTRGRCYLLSLRIRDLEQRLPDPPFLRVHRSHIVNLDYVDRILPVEGARFEVRMKDGAVVPVSRARARQIRRWSR